MQNLLVVYYEKILLFSTTVLRGDYQGKYWEMVEALFSQQRRLGKPLYQELAAGFNLDAAAFEACLNDSQSQQAVASSLSHGKSLGVQGTPHFFIGRRVGNTLMDVQRISGAQEGAVFTQMIEQLLK